MAEDGEDSNRFEMMILKRSSFNGSIGRKPVELEKNPYSKDKNQQQIWPTFTCTILDWSGNWTRDTLVGGKRSRHYTIPAPQDISILKLVVYADISE